MRRPSAWNRSSQKRAPEIKKLRTFVTAVVEDSSSATPAAHAVGHPHARTNGCVELPNAEGIGGKVRWHPIEDDADAGLWRVSTNLQIVR